MTDNAGDIEIDVGDDTAPSVAAPPDPKSKLPAKANGAPDPKDEVIVERAEAGDGKEPEKKALAPEEGIGILKQKLADEQAARQKAEREARQATETTNRVTQQLRTSEFDMVKQAIGTVKQDSDMLKAKYKEALSTQDYDAAAEAQSLMATNAAKLFTLETGLNQMEQQARQQQARPAPRNDNPVEAFAAQLQPRAASWIRAHPDYVTNDRLRQKLAAAHNLVLSDGVAEGSDEYFEAVEKIVLPKAAEPAPSIKDDEPLSVAATTTQRRSSPPAAPVSRSGTADGSRPNVVRLTAQQREMAALTGLTEKEYASQLIKIEREKTG